MMHKKVIIFKYSAYLSNGIVGCITYINGETLVRNVLQTHINSEFADSDSNSVETNFRIQFRISFRILISEFRLEVRIRISTSSDSWSNVWPTWTYESGWLGGVLQFVDFQRKIMGWFELLLLIEEILWNIVGGFRAVVRVIHVQTTQK